MEASKRPFSDGRAYTSPTSDSNGPIRADHEAIDPVSGVKRGLKTRHLSMMALAGIAGFTFSQLLYTTHRVVTACHCLSLPVTACHYLLGRLVCVPSTNNTLTALLDRTRSPHRLRRRSLVWWSRLPHHWVRCHRCHRLLNHAIPRRINHALPDIRCLHQTQRPLL